MSRVTSNFKFFATAAGVLGIIQGVIWLALSTVAVVSFYVCDIFDPNISVFGIFFSYMQRTYFLGPTCPDSLGGTLEIINLRVVRSRQLVVWMFTYVILSAVWILSSSLVIIGTNIKVMKTPLTKFCYFWTILTLSISCLDIAIGILFGIDSATFASRFDFQNTLNAQAYLFLSAGSFSLMIISFRGFLLILINLSFAVYLFVQSFVLQKEIDNYKHNIHTEGPIQAYGSNMQQNSQWNSALAEQTIQRSQNGYDNNAFTVSQENISSSNSERSDSWHEVKVNNQHRPKIQHEPLKDPDSSERNQKRSQSTETKSPRTFAPYTPTPDYSPPSVRQTRLKPTLKR